MPLHFSGPSAKLLDIKKAIVVRHKLDRIKGVDFELTVGNASTGEEYGDDSILIHRGTRLILKRLPAERGRGILATIANSDSPLVKGNGRTSIHRSFLPQKAHILNSRSACYSIDARNEDDDEFVSSSSNHVLATPTLHTNVPGTSPSRSTRLASFRPDHRQASQPEMFVKDGRPPKHRNA